MTAHDRLAELEALLAWHDTEMRCGCLPGGGGECERHAELEDIENLRFLLDRCRKLQAVADASKDLHAFGPDVPEGRAWDALIQALAELEQDT